MRDKPAIGKRVMYSAAFVRNAGHDAEISQRRGTVVAVPQKVGKGWYVKIRWDDETDENARGALSSNLERAVPLATRGIL